MAGAFSLLGPMRTTPYAIGERGPNSTIPLMPDLSGQAAIDSLAGYYSMKRQDSLLGAHRPMKSGPRKTNYPNTKVAELAMRALDVAQSQFVAGFLLRCKEAGVQGTQHVFSAIQQAMVTHPAVAAEFVKCGMVKVAMYGPSFHAPSDYITTKPSGPKKVDISYDQGLDIGSASPTAENFAASQAKMRLPTKPIKPIPGLGTPALDTLSSQATQYSRPQAPAPSGTLSRPSQMRPTPPPTAPEISTVPREQWTPELVQQWQKRQAEGAYSKHPYLRSHGLGGEWTREMPERIGDFRTDEQGFSADLAQYVAGFTPDAKKRFAAIVEESGMEPEAIIRAWQSQRELAGKMPMMETSARQAAQQLYDRGERQDAPVSPDYNTIMRNYYELNPKWREDMLRWQQYEQGKWPRHGANAPEDPGTWIFPPRSEFAHEGWDPENVPRMLEHTKYQGLPQYMQTFTEPKSKDLAAYWKEQMGRVNDPKRSGEHVAPQNYARAYTSDRQRRMTRRQFWEERVGGDSDVLPLGFGQKWRGWLPTLIQRIPGFRKDHPTTGKEIIQTRGLGRHEGGLSGAATDTIAGSMFMAPATVASAVAGKKDIASMVATDVFALPNYLFGTDVGWEANIGAKPPGFEKHDPGRALVPDIDSGINVTRGFFGKRPDSTTGAYKKSGTGMLGEYFGAKANDPKGNAASRIANIGMQVVSEKGGPALAALTAMRALKMNPKTLGQVMRQLSATGAVMGAAPTLLDPYRSHYNPATKDTPAAGAAWPRLKETVGRGIQGAFLPFTANPGYAMAGKALRETPVANKYYKGPDWLRLATMRDDGEASTLGSLGEGAATATEWAPSLMLYGRGAVSPKHLGLAGLAGAANAPEGAGYREMVQNRYNMAPDEFRQLQERESRIDKLRWSWQRNIKADPAVLAQALAGASPEDAVDIRRLAAMPAGQRALELQRADLQWKIYAKHPPEMRKKLSDQLWQAAADEAMRELPGPQAPPPRLQAPQKFDPGLVAAPEGMSAEQATTARYGAMDVIWENMLPQQQQKWIQRKQALEEGLFQSYSQMAEAQGQSPDRVQQVAKADAEKQWMTEFSAAHQMQLQAQPAIGGQ